MPYVRIASMHSAATAAATAATPAVSAAPSSFSAAPSDSSSASTHTGAGPDPAPSDASSSASAGSEERAGSNSSDSTDGSDSSTDDSSSWRSRWSSFRPALSESASAVLLMLQFVGFLHVVRSEVVDIMSCAGPSMLPTMAEGGDVLLVAKSNVVVQIYAWMERAAIRAGIASLPAGASLAPNYSFSSRSPREWLAPSELTYERGDVVVAASPNNPRQKVCKRLLAFEGESVGVATTSAGWWGVPVVQRRPVPQGHVWLQGDNLSNSTDSRSYGPVPRALVQGKVVWKLYPLREWGPVFSTLEYAAEALEPPAPAEPQSLGEALARWAAETDATAPPAENSPTPLQPQSQSPVSMVDALQQREREWAARQALVQEDAQARPASSATAVTDLCPAPLQPLVPQPEPQQQQQPPQQQPPLTQLPQQPHPSLPSSPPSVADTTTDLSSTTTSAPVPAQPLSPSPAPPAPAGAAEICPVVPAPATPSQPVRATEAVQPVPTAAAAATKPAGAPAFKDL